MDIDLYVLKMIIMWCIFSATALKAMTRTVHNGIQIFACIVCATLLSYHCMADDAWQRFSPPFARGGTISCFCEGRQGSICALTDNYIYRLDSDRATWIKLDNLRSQGDLQLLTLANSRDGIIYVGTSHGIYSSFDNGLHWSHEATALTNVQVSTIYVDTNNIVLAGSWGQIFRSTDSSRTWKEVGTEIDSKYKFGNAHFRDDSIGAIQVSFGSIVYYSRNSGLMWRRWSPLDANESYYGIKWTHDRKWKVKAAFTMGSYYGQDAQSDDVKQTYGAILHYRESRTFSTRRFSDLFYYQTAGLGSYFESTESGGIIVQNADTVLYGSRDYGITKAALCNTCDNSVNMGAGQFANNGLKNLSVSCLYKDKRDVYFCGTYGAGVFISSDSGNTWHEMNDGMIEGGVYCMLRVSTGDSIVLCGTESGLYRSADEYKSWSRDTAGLENYCIYTLEFTKKGSLLAGTQSGIYRSIDSGRSWKSMKAPSYAPDTYVTLTPYILCNDFVVMNDNTILAASLNGLWVSRDDGLSWQARNATHDANFGGRLIHMRWDTTSNKLYVTATDSCMMSSDTGKTWVGYSLELGKYVGIDLTDHIVSIVGEASILSANVSLPNIVFSEISANLSKGVHEYSCQAVCRDQMGSLYVGSMRGGVVRSIDGGGVWSKWSTGMNTDNVLDFVRDKSNYLYALTADDGIYRTVAPLAQLDSPQLVWPLAGAVTDSSSIAATWTSVTNAIDYELQLSADSLFGSNVQSFTNITSPRKTLSLSTLSMYYWRVRARRNTLLSAWSEIRSIQRISRAPEKLMLLSPANDSIVPANSVELHWGPSSNKTGYEFQVATDSLFTALTIQNANVSTESAIVHELHADSVYYWHVRAFYSTLFGPWSDIWHFGVGLGAGVSIDERETQLSVTPNPANDYAHVSTGRARDASGVVRVFDCLGMLVLQTLEPDVNVSSIPSGLYRVDIERDGVHRVASMLVYH